MDEDGGAETVARLTKFLKQLRGGRGLQRTELPQPPDSETHELLLGSGASENASVRAVLAEALRAVAESPELRARIPGRTGSSHDENEVLLIGQVAWAIQDELEPPLPLKPRVHNGTWITIPVSTSDSRDFATLSWLKRTDAKNLGWATVGSGGGFRARADALAHLMAEYLVEARRSSGFAGVASTVRFSPDGLVEVDVQASTLDVWWPVPPTKDSERRPSRVRLPPDFPDDPAVLAVRSLGHAVVVTIAAGDGTSTAVVSNEEDVVERVVLSRVRATAAAHSARGLYAVEEGRCVPLGDADHPPFPGLTEIVALDAVEDALGPAMLAVTQSGEAHFARWTDGVWRPLAREEDRPHREGPALVRPQRAPWAPWDDRPVST